MPQINLTNDELEVLSRYAAYRKVDCYRIMNGFQPATETYKDYVIRKDWFDKLSNKLSKAKE